MRKFTFMLIAAFMAVISYAQAPLPYEQKNLLNIADKAKAEQQLHPVTGKVQLPVQKRVKKTGKGLYIINGKKVVVKRDY